MNQLVILFAIVVGFTYFGGTSVPKMLKDNQQVLLGVLVGLMIGQMNLVEGIFDDACTKAGDCMKGKSATWSANKTTDLNGNCCNDEITCETRWSGNECSGYDDAQKCALKWSERSGSGGDKVGPKDSCDKSKN